MALRNVLRPSELVWLNLVQKLSPSIFQRGNVDGLAKALKRNQLILARNYSSSKKERKILSQSTILLQDGLEIHEMPLIMKRISGSDFPILKSFPSPIDIRRETEEESAFQLQLRDCPSMRRVFTLLEVPSTAVTSYAAAFALQRLSQLFIVSDDKDIHSFVKKAVLSELCETVLREIQRLSADALLSLIECSFNVDFFDKNFAESLQDEVERRIGDGCFSVEEICAAIRLYSLPKGDELMLEDLWAHLSNRHADINEANIATIYEILPMMSPRHKFMYKILDKCMKHCWWKLTGTDIATVSKTLAMCNHQSASTLTSFGRWMFLNVHTLKDAELIDIMSAFTHFSFFEPHMIQAVERYLDVKAERHLSKTLIAQVMEYFRNQRYVSPRVLSAVARDFCVSGNEYTEKQIQYILRPYGHFCYTPHQAAQFFLKVEEVLMTRFNDFDPSAMLELLASFVYLQRLPLNFVSKVFTPHYQAKIKSIPDVKLQKNAIRHLLELQAAVKVEYPQFRFPHMYGSGLHNINLSWIDTPMFKMHQELGAALMNLLGVDKVRDVHIPTGTPHIINFVIFVSDGMAVPVSEEDGDAVQRLALVIMQPTAFCVNAPVLLGEHQLKLRHLVKLGYKAIQISTTDFAACGKKSESKAMFLKETLAPYITFSNDNEIIIE